MVLGFRIICNLRPLKLTTIKLKTTFWTNKRPIGEEWS